MAAIAVARRRIISYFMSRDATSPEKAVFYEPDRLRRRLFERLRQAGVVEQEGARYWLNVPAWDRASRLRRRIAAGAVLAMGVAAALLA